MSLSAFAVYCEYMAIKLHFSSKSYDYFKYNASVKADPASFETKKDRFYFEKIKRKYAGKKSSITGFFLSNLKSNPKKWIGELTDESSSIVYKEWQAYQESLTYNFKEEISKLESILDGKDPNSLILIEDGQHPKLLELHYSGQISEETLIIMNRILKFFGYWNKNIEDSIIWPNTFHILKKYEPFITFDLDKCTNILKSHFIKP